MRGGTDDRGLEPRGAREREASVGRPVSGQEGLHLRGDASKQRQHLVSAALQGGEGVVEGRPVEALHAPARLQGMQLARHIDEVAPEDLADERAAQLEVEAQRGALGAPGE